VYATLQTISRQRSSSSGFDVVTIAEGTPNAAHVEGLVSVTEAKPATSLSRRSGRARPTPIVDAALREARSAARIPRGFNADRDHHHTPDSVTCR
jgi:hypothetical protein